MDRSALLLEICVDVPEVIEPGNPHQTCIK